MTDRNKILYEVESQSDLVALQRAVQEIHRLGGSLDELDDEQRRLKQSGDDATESTKGMGIAWQSVMEMGIVGFLGMVAGAIGGLTNLIMRGIGAVQNWALAIDDLSHKLSITHEEATALATSWKLAGVDIAEGTQMIMSFQGRLIDELEAQKEASKAIAEIQEQRIDLLADLAKAEEDHQGRLADLEAQKAELQNASFDEVVARRDEQLADLEADYADFLENQRYAEEEETRRLEEVWRDRVRTYERTLEDMRDDLTDKARKARNFREWSEAVQQYQKKQQRLRQDLDEEKDKNETAAERRVATAERAAEREREIYEEKKAAIIAKADEEVAQLQERNAKALADVEERIEAENEAWADQQESHNERLADLAQAEVEAAEKGASLSFAMQQLGVDMFDADGKMRPVDDLLWDMKDALEAMPDGAEKAAIIADLGWEDMAYWINEGANATEALTFAQDNNLIVTQQMIDNIRIQNELLAEMQLKMLGMGLEIAEGTGAFEGFIWVLEKVNDALTTLMEIVEVLMAPGGFKALMEEFSNTGGLLGTIGDVGGFFAQGGGLGQLTSGAGELLGLQEGGPIPGQGPRPMVGHGGEFVVPERGALVLRDQGGKRAITVNVNAPVYGVEDLQTAIAGAIARADRGGVTVGVR